MARAFQPILLSRRLHCWLDESASSHRVPDGRKSGENESALTVLADLPGVKAKNLKIDLRENILTLTAVEDSPQAEKETDVFREYECGTFFRQFTLAETIDQAKIEAELHDGVLRLQLPKTEAARPRQIAVKAS